MGIFDKLKDQALNGLNEIQERVNNVQNQQQSVTPPPVPQPQMPPPPAPQPSQSDNSDGIYGNYMEHLIDMALADGELTEKEKQVLFKKAEANGIDLDEFEMVLDARLYERQKATQAVQPTTQGAAPKSEKYGDVRKCPGCGAIVESFTTRCPDCGHEFSNIGTVSSFNLLSSKLEALENKKKGTIWGVIKDESIDKQKVSLINGFPVPTTKEDILEFVSMATPLAKPANKLMIFTDLDAGQYGVAKAWKSKCEQVIMKARFSMKEDKATLAEIERYAKELKIK
jgi:hypothetical protein